MRTISVIVGATALVMFGIVVAGTIAIRSGKATYCSEDVARLPGWGHVARFVAGCDS